MDEGCGQRGYYEFSSEENRVDFIWPGNDIMDGGTYTQTGSIIEIKSMYGEVYNLTLSKDGIELTNNFGFVFRDVNYPWE